MDVPLDLSFNSQRYNVHNNNQFGSFDHRVINNNNHLMQSLTPYQLHFTSNNDLVQPLNDTYLASPQPFPPPPPPLASALEFGHMEADSLSRPFKAISRNPAILFKNFEMRKRFKNFCEKFGIDERAVAKRNDNMKRTNKLQSPAINKTAEYMKQRQKNNEAAKRSRDNRKRKEDEIALQLIFFEKENADLKVALRHLEAENERLRQLLKVCN